MTGPAEQQGMSRMNAFVTRIQEECELELTAGTIDTLQVNIGLKCNLSCVHCHLACGPDREEEMNRETMAAVVEAANVIRPDLVDITGGAPEVNPHFRVFITELRKHGHPVQVRTNLTAMLSMGLHETAAFLRDHKVHLVASLPCYLEENVCRQRGEGTYEKSVEVLQELNSLGYGTDPELSLSLVYNPGGPFLPPDQAQLEADYRRELKERFGIEFTRLYTIANMPIGRFWRDLDREEKADEYMQLLVEGFNCHTVDGLMCRHQINIGWDGTIYDCDFNLALDLPVGDDQADSVHDFRPELLEGRAIASGDHCFGCTAGAGSSCAGALL